MSEGYLTPAAPLRAIVDELVRAGVHHVVICPGSRSTPMALALRAAPELQTWVHLDERAGAFFALGAARAGRAPVAILATSGTAVVNFAPAVAEARYGRVPLILLTADRPPELHGLGSPQTIDQVELYGRHAKWYAELPVPDESPEAEIEVRSLVRRALDVATAAPAGPVQLNMPFREPLLPVGSLRRAPAAARPSEPDQASGVGAHDLEGVVSAARAAARPLIVCGPSDEPGFAPAIARLAAVLGAPIVADALANVRNGPHDRSSIVAFHDALLRWAPFAEAHRPDLVVRFGDTPTSKVLTRTLDGPGVRQLLVDDGRGWNRPAGPTIRRIDADPVACARAMADVVSGESSSDPAWLASWRAADLAAGDALETWFATLDEVFEGAVPRAFDAALPEGTVVVAGNSMPVRDIDAFMPASSRARRLLGNRGANGIDGLALERVRGHRDAGRPGGGRGR